MAVVQNNTMTKCNQGGANAVYGINVQSGAYPTASNKIVKDDNNSDAAVPFNNTNSIPVTETRENGIVLGYLDGVTSAIQTQIDGKQDVGGGGGSSLELLNNSGNAFLKVETNTDQAGNSTSIILRAESSTSTLDRQYDITTDPANNDDLILLCHTNQNGALEGFRFNPGGRCSFAGGNNPITSFSAADFQVRGSAWFRNVMRITGVTTLEDNVVIGASGGSKTLTLNGDLITASSPSPTFHHYVLYNKPTAWTQLGSGSHILVLGDGGSGEKSQTYYLTLPASPSVGDTIEVRCMAQVHLKLPTENTTSLYNAIFDQMSNNKSITYSCFNDEFHGIVTYVQHPQYTTQYSWVSTTGGLY
jgi:hypothetical protein